MVPLWCELMEIPNIPQGISKKVFGVVRNPAEMETSSTFRTVAVVCPEAMFSVHADEFPRGSLCGYTPLHDAAWAGHTEAINALAAAGNRVNITNRWGSTPLHMASISGHDGAVRALIRAGADFDARDRNGDTPLHDASARGQERPARYT